MYWHRVVYTHVYTCVFFMYMTLYLARIYNTLGIIDAASLSPAADERPEDGGGVQHQDGQYSAAETARDSGQKWGRIVKHDYYY